MSRALAVYHGRFGRASLYQLDKGMATHAHREGHLTFHVGGKPTRMQIDGEWHQLDQVVGTAINPWQLHSFEASDPVNGSVFLVLYIRPEWFSQLGQLPLTGMRFGRSIIEMSSEINVLVDRNTRMLLDGEASQLFEGHLLDLTQACFEQTWTGHLGAMSSLNPSSSLRDFRIRNSIKLMKARLGEGESILLNSIARGAGLSRPHFFKLFKENTGITPNIYLNTLRMETAIDRLTLSSDAVTSIGLDLGFSSQASFTRFFASNVGIPPTDYRRVVQMTA